MRGSFLAFGALLILGACTHVAHDARAPWGSAPVPIAAADLNWTALDPTGAPGVQIAPAWGDPSRSAFGAFLKLPAGFAAPLHTHTHPMKVVIVSGTYIQQPEGSTEFRLGPGSYLMQPGGNYRHVTRCASDAECVFYFESEGPFDLHVAQ
jgi:anti-sigma factor ChrR (cupin superfamily)